MSTTLNTSTSPRFFYGWVMVMIAGVKGSFNVGSAVFATSMFLGPMLLGSLRDWQGSYTVPFIVVIGTWLLAGLAIFMAKTPKVDDTESTT